MLRTAAITLICYVLGSVPCAVITTRLFYGRDIRRIGSGNPGAMNVLLNVGHVVGLLTFVGDIGKAVFALFLTSRLVPGELPLACAATAVIAGHNWSAFLRFEGGKGLSCLGGVLLYLDWRLLVAALGLYFLGLAVSRKVPVAVVISLMFLPAAFWGLRKPIPLIALSALFPLLIVSRHLGDLRAAFRHR